MDALQILLQNCFLIFTHLTLGKKRHDMIQFNIGIHLKLKYLVSSKAFLQKKLFQFLKY